MSSSAQGTELTSDPGASRTRARRRLWRLLWRRLGRRLSRHPITVLAALSLATTLGCWLRAEIVGYPDPLVADEVAYLLTADTFLDGRLAAPPHPHWQHFEQLNVLSQPTFASKHPPGQSVILAWGELLFGHPAAGVWISAGLLVFGVGWMLLAWTRPPWALLGALLVALRFGPGHVWSESYWGGYLAAFGGAVAFGAWRRVVDGLRTPQPVSVGVFYAGAALGAGLAILAWTRPFEGLLATLPAAAVLGIASWRRLRAGGRLRGVAGVVVAVVAILAPALAGLGAYHHAVTGDPFVFPHRLYEREYSLLPQFVFEALPEEQPTFRHRDLEAMSRGLFERYWEGDRIWVGPREAFSRLGRLLVRSVGPFVLVVLIWNGRYLLRRRWTAFAAVSIVFVALGHAVAQSYMFHYSAPVLPLVVFLGIVALRHLYRSRTRWGALALVALFVFEAAAFSARLAQPPREMPWFQQKTRIAEELVRRPGRDLVFVRYGPYHLPHWDWISNTGDLASQEIVWARTMTAAENLRLRRHFADRRAWFVDVAHDLWDPWTPPPVRLIPFDEGRRPRTTGTNASSGVVGEMDSVTDALTEESSP